jgi:alkanesulfonate monooxygenase SsuD/methylene tetrahydromethanopterin reductase-like flavin-dependent oxidoreductase (luciferase family)
MRLGVGIGWNHVEYEALGQNFHNRGRRIGEQIVLMRQLWSGELIDFDGRYETVLQAGICPLPVQRPIPVWMGGGADAVLRRIAKIADGWFPQFQPGPQGAEPSRNCAGTSATPAARSKTLGSKGESACTTRRKTKSAVRCRAGEISARRTSRSTR